MLMLLREKEVLNCNLDIISVSICLQSLLVFQASLLPRYRTVLLAQFPKISLNLSQSLQAFAASIDDLASNREE